MSLKQCVFVVAGGGGGVASGVRARAQSLARFYSVSGLDGVSITEHPPARLVWGRIGAGPQSADVLAWGAPFGARDVRRDDVLADDATLRRTAVGFGAAAACHGDRARVMTAPAGPCSLYCAEGPAYTVWSSHAVAAAYLAHGTAELDPAAIPALIAYDFVGGGRTLLAHTTAIPPATCVEIGPAGQTTRSFWPPTERWAPAPEEEAHRHAERALLDSLALRAGSGRKLALALTAGADSRVLGVALHELGAPTEAFVWGADGWPDVEGAREVAAALGMRFSRLLAWRDDSDLREIFDGETRWSDGVLILSPSQRLWPQDVDGIVLGAAGEVGRAFYYGNRAAGREPEGETELADILRPEGRLVGAAASAHELARSAVLSWIAAAGESGHRGWRLLDVLYAEQRVAHWGRAQMPPLAIDVLAGFASQEVLRGLVSLPLRERVTDGFHRRFLAEHHPALRLPPAAATATSRGPASRLAGRLRLRSRRPPAAANPFLLSIWAERPDTRAWVAEEALPSPLIVDVMGRGWVERTRQGFLGGNPAATDHAAVACGPVALSAALATLDGDGG